MSKLLPTLMVIVFLTAVIALLYLPIGVTASASVNSSIIENNLIEESPEAALRAHTAWKSASLRSSQTIQEALMKLEHKYPTDYQFTLERIRGSKNLMALKSGAEKIELLAIAAKKAIAEDKTAVMLADLRLNRRNTKDGFGKLINSYGQNWKRIEIALKQKNAKSLARFIKAAP